MIELGKIHKLRIKRITKDGAFLNEELEQNEDILLPLHELERTMTANDEVEAFVYRDSDDHLVSTLKPVKLTVGELAVLKVVELNAVGAFLDWGLEKQLLLPYGEQTYRVTKGSEVLVALYVDNTQRLAATMNVYEKLRSDSPYHLNDRVKGMLYKIHPQYGAFVAVENRFHGLVPLKECFGNYREGMIVDARVKKVQADGKLELSLRDAAVNEMTSDSQKIMQKMKGRHGRLSLHDKSDPDDINRELQMSKAAFKRAIGKLYKDGIIRITERGIELIQKDETN